MNYPSLQYDKKGGPKISYHDISYILNNRLSSFFKRKMLANDKDFPAIKKEKQYQIELNSFKKYLETSNN